MLASLNRDDVWPVADLGLMEAVKRIKKLEERPSEEDMEKISQIWSLIEVQWLMCYGHLMTKF